MTMVVFPQFQIAIRASRIVKVKTVPLKTQMVPRDDGGKPVGFIASLLFPSKIKMVEVVTQKPELKLTLSDRQEQVLNCWRGDAPKVTDIEAYRAAERHTEALLMPTIRAVAQGGGVVSVPHPDDEAQKGPEPVAPDQDAEANAQARPQAQMGGDDAAQA